VEVAENAVTAPNDGPRLALDKNAEGVCVAGKNRGDDATCLRIVRKARVGPLELSRSVDRSVSWAGVTRRAGIQ
jgi:hypothetical protein